MRRLAIAAPAAAVLAAFFIGQAHAHDWFTTKKDPVFGWPCCGSYDCAPVKLSSHNIKAEKDGFHIRLSLEETRAINPHSEAPIDGIVTYDRVQPSETDEWAICIMPSNRGTRSAGVFCLFAPPDM